MHMLENNNKKNDLCIHLQKFIRANQTLKKYDRNNEHKKKNTYLIDNLTKPKLF